MVAFCVRLAPSQPATSPHAEAVRLLLDVGAKAPQSLRERGDSIAFLDPQLSGAADAELAAMRGERREHRKLVNQAGNLVGRDNGGAEAGVPDPNRPNRLMGLFGFECRFDVRAHPAEHVEDRRPRRVEPHVLDRHVRVRQRGRDQPERRG